MNYITVIAEDAHEVNEAFIASLKEHGGGVEGDVLTVICSKWTPDYNQHFKQLASKYFGGVIMFERSLAPCLDRDYESYSEEVLCFNLFFARPHGVVCYIPMGYRVTEPKWSETIQFEYRNRAKEWMGSTKLFEPETGSRVMYGPFVTDGYNFTVIPMLRTYHKSIPMLERARCYVSRSYSEFKLPFASGPVNTSEAPVETSEDNFSVTTPKKIESIPSTPKKKTAKKATKKKARKRPAKKKAKAKAPISPAVVVEATNTLQG